MSFSHRDLRSNSPPQIDQLQLVLALVVAAREVSYFILCLVGCVVAPHYLLTNVAAGWWMPEGESSSIPLRERLTNMAWFGLSPEKFLVSVILETKSAMNVFLLALDLCAVMAFTVGLIRSMPAPLAVRCVNILPSVCIVLHRSGKPDYHFLYTSQLCHYFPGWSVDHHIHGDLWYSYAP